MSTCAFNIINHQFRIAPGTVFRDVVRMYNPGILKHILFVSLFLWELETQRLASKTVAWLLAVPISEAESAFAVTEGAGRLEALFEERQIDVFDFRRTSVV